MIEQIYIESENAYIGQEEEKRKENDRRRERVSRGEGAGKS
jgi:hypothetical protein